jgi:hypothetical protein
MTQLVAFLVIIAVAAVGDLLSVKTKARIPSLLVMMAIFMVGFWGIFPKDIVEVSGLAAMGALATPIIVTHMGTLMSFKQVGNQWKALLVGLGAIIGVGVVVFPIVSAVYGKYMAVSAAAPISGGIVAAIMAMDAMKAAGKPELQVLAMLFLSIQGLIGMPIAANLLKKDVKNNWDKIIDSHKTKTANSENTKEVKKLIPSLPKAYQTPFVLLAKLVLIAFLAVSTAALFNDVIHPYIMTLLFGLIAYYLGFLEGDLLSKANCLPFLMLLLIASILPAMTYATPKLVVSMIGPLLLGFAVAIIGVGIMSYFVGRLVGFSKEMAISVGSTALYGFPGNYMIVQEVARSASSNPEEQKAILDYILPPMIVGGYSTVTIGSVLLAGILLKFL